MSIMTVTIGGGCFWCTEAIFRETTGVVDVIAGFSGGFIKNPAYKEVCTGRTGHAEVIQVVYDQAIISYEDILVLHFLTHDPTSLDQQGADKGSQYRSVVFYQTEEEKGIAEKVICNMGQSFDLSIVTEVKPFEVFYKAEDKHQNYYQNNSDAFYCQAVIVPKLVKYRELKKDLDIK